LTSPRCPRCGGLLADSAASCAACARPITLDLTARVPKKPQLETRRPVLRDAVLLLGGAAGLVAASISDDWKLAGGIIAGALVLALVLQLASRR
jgi:hypothetical protein